MIFFSKLLTFGIVLHFEKSTNTTKNKTKKNLMVQTISSWDNGYPKPGFEASILPLN